MPGSKYETIEDDEKTVFWISKEFPFMIKIEDSEMTAQYRNIKLGALDDSLFEPSVGYEKNRSSDSSAGEVSVTSEIEPRLRPAGWIFGTASIEHSRDGER